MPLKALTGLALAAGLLLLPRSAAAQMTTGSYVGDGTVGRKITGLGFRPDVVIVKGNDSDGTFAPTSTIMRTSTMAGDSSKPMVLNNALVGNEVQSLDVDGFTVGSERRVNQTGITFFWAAFKVDADMKLGTYTGNGGAQSIAGLGFSPEYVIVMSSTNRRAVQAASTAPVGRSFEFESAAWLANQITSLDPTGFSVVHNGAAPYANENLVVYHYVAWNDAPLKTKVGSYAGNATDNRSINGVGFQPEYLIVKAIYNNNVLPALTPPGHQRYAQMIGDATYNFAIGPAADLLQAFQVDGFQIGAALSVNRTFADCNLDGPGCSYFYVAFNLVCPGCPPLGVTEGVGTVTVTAPNSFEMTFDTNVAGGAIATFHDLAEDPGRANDLAGSLETSNGPRGLHNFGMIVGGTAYNVANNVAGARADVLEATSTRVRVRQESFYQNGVAGPILAGVKGLGDYSVYPAGRTALRWERRTTSPVTYTAEYSELVVHRLAVLPLSGWATYRELGTIPPAGTGNDAFLMAQNEQAGARTDFLQILHRDWTIANGYPGTADLTDATTGAPSERINMYWDELTGAALATGASHVWSSLTYFKPTSFANQADTAVTSRSADYRTHPAGEVTINGGKGSQWSDAAESTAAGTDWFNEAEAVYPLELNQALGLDFTLDGATTKRYAPFFKIRQWRSFVEAPVVTLNTGSGAVPLTKDLDYKAAVKPVSRAHFATDVLWHSTLADAVRVDTFPSVGNPGALSNIVAGDFVAARYGTGLNISASNQHFALTTNPGGTGIPGFDKARGAIGFWFRPSWAHNDGTRHDICGFSVDANNYFLLEKRDGAGGNDLRLRVRATGMGAEAEVHVLSTDYSWRANDWVHLRIEWDDAVFPAAELRLVLNGRAPTQSVPGDYNSAGLTLPADNRFRFGNADGGADFSPGIYDEVYSYGRVPGHTHPAAPLTPKPLAAGGLASSPNEFFASNTAPSNFQIALTSDPGGGQSEHLYVGADSRFRGLNIALAIPGTGTCDDPGLSTGCGLKPFYWDGEGWAALSGAVAVTDTTRNLQQSGTISWAGDPAGWAPYSINGGPDLYYLRFEFGYDAYATFPTEAVIKTDILLFQYCGDATTAANFAFAVPATTAVTLQSFSAAPGDASVVLEWRTASELDNLGFHVYRGFAEAGPWTRLTSSLIPGLGSSAVGRAYSLRDTGLSNGTRYFYKLEDVDAASKTTSHGPVSAVPLAGAPAGAPGSEPPASSQSGKKKGASPASCPDWVVAAYGSLAGASASSAALTCTRHGDPEAVSLGVVSRDSRSATLELKTGGFYALRERSGKVRVFVPGFDFPQDPQAPALPFRRALVDAVVGRRAQLAGVRALDPVAFPGLVPVALGTVEMQVSRDGTARAGRRTPLELSPQHVPLDLARLLPSVFQGETKSAVVALMPLRYDARRRQIVLSKRLLVRLLFTGRETGERGRGSLGRREKPQAPVAGELVARLYTTSPGLYAASFERLVPGQSGGFAASQLRLERQGEARGFHLEPAGDLFGPGSVLYFHAHSAAASTAFSSETAWELVRARDGIAMPLVSAAPSGDAVPTASTGRASFESDRFYQPGLLEAPDLWLWEALASGATRAKSFSLTGVDAASSQAAEIEVFLQGASESGGPVDHHVSVSLNGALAGEAQFAGKKPYRMSLSVPVSLLREGSNELSLTNVADTGVSSLVFLDRYAISNPQTASLASGVFEGSWSQGGTATLSGVAGPVALLDVTLSPSWMRGYQSTGGSLRFRAEAGHRYLAVSPQGLLSPRVAAPSPSRLRSAQNQADYLLIAPRAFLAAAEPLLQRRQDQGLWVRAVAFEEISDEFGHGQGSAEAIKAFLAFAFQSWTRPSPRYVLLLGDSSYDPRNFMGSSRPSPLPALWVKTSYLWTVSDPQLGAVNGEDELPDLAIGRLPATSVDEARVLVDKLVAWEDSGQGLAGPAVLVADNPDLAGDFEANADDIAQGLLAGRSEVLRLRELGAGTRPRIQAALDSGLSYLSYIGHGGAAVWASENVWNSWDAASLQAQSRQPLLVTLNCLNGYFVAPGFDSLSESLLKAEGRGAIAAFSPSGLSLDAPAHQYHGALMAELTSGRHERLGDAVTAAQKAYAQSGLMPELLSIYHLLGDPATRIR